jgi:hypothetical protein
MKHDARYIKFIGDWLGPAEEEIRDEAYRRRGDVGE